MKSNSPILKVQIYCSRHQLSSNLSVSETLNGGVQMPIVKINKII